MKVYNRYLFQDSSKDDYFEGWYFKQVPINNKTISFIPGISKAKDDKHAFIQIISLIDDETYYIRFDYKDFSYGMNPFYIKIKDNYFSLEKIVLNIDEPVLIKGTIYFDDLMPIKQSLISPNIMGWYAYLPFMECNHCIISLKHSLSGTIQFNQDTIEFDNGIGYIEKDYGTSFPTKYIWLESNNSDEDSSIFFSYATIPFGILSFKGLICIFEYEGVQYRFATYNFAKVLKFNKTSNNKIGIELKKGNYLLKIDISSNNSQPLIAPKKGNMKNTVYESLDSEAKVELLYKGKIVYSSNFYACGLEIFDM